MFIVQCSAMAPTPRVESFEEMAPQRHQPVYAPSFAPSFPFPTAANLEPPTLDPKVGTNITTSRKHSITHANFQVESNFELDIRHARLTNEATENLHLHHNHHSFHFVWFDDHHHLQTTSKPGASSSSDSSSDSESDKPDKSDSESDEEAVKNDDGFGLGDIIRAAKNSPRVGSMSDRSTKPTPSPRWPFA